MKFHTADPKLRQLLDTVSAHLPLDTRGQDELTVDVEWASAPNSLPSWKKADGKLSITCYTAGDALMLIGRGLTQSDKTSETLEPRFSGGLHSAHTENLSVPTGHDGLYSVLSLYGGHL